MNHDFWGNFGTYLCQHANNETMVKFPRGNKTFSKKGVMGRKLSRTATSTKDIYQNRLSYDWDILVKTFGTDKSLRMKPKR